MEDKKTKSLSTKRKIAKTKDEVSDLSDFEETLVWMSYRYAIGRRTIASCMHAGDIAKYAYSRMSESRRKFCAKDIRNTIADALNWRSEFCFYVDPYIPDHLYKPMELLIDFAKENGITSYKQLSDYRHIHAKYDYKTQKVVFEATKKDVDILWVHNLTLRVGDNVPKEYQTPEGAFLKYFKDKGIRTAEDLKENRFIGMTWNEETNDADYYIEKSFKSEMSIDLGLRDYIGWAMLASLFDLESHKFCKVRYEGKEEIVEYFEAYEEDYSSNNDFSFVKRKVGVKQYMERPSVGGYLCEEYIIEDNVQPI